MTFLPEADQDYLRQKAIAHELLTEAVPDGSHRRAILFPSFALADGKFVAALDGQMVARAACELLVLVPTGYATTKLDSFYTYPRLRLVGGGDPDRATGETDMFGKKWQFWSRHLDEADWRVGKDGIDTYLAYIRTELSRP